jgi:hypothetical protein
MATSGIDELREGSLAEVSELYTRDSTNTVIMINKRKIDRKR